MWFKKIAVKLLKSTHSHKCPLQFRPIQPFCSQKKGFADWRSPHEYLTKYLIRM